MSRNICSATFGFSGILNLNSPIFRNGVSFLGRRLGRQKFEQTLAEQLLETLQQDVRLRAEFEMLVELRVALLDLFIFDVEF